MNDFLPKKIAEKKPSLGVEGRHEGLPLHYGWIQDEQDRFDQGVGYAYFGPVGVVTVSGPDNGSWLTTLSSQVLTELEPGVSKEFLLLDPQGRIEFQVGAGIKEGVVWLLTEAQYAAPLAEFLRSMQFMLRVEVEDRTADFVGIATANEIQEAKEEHAAFALAVGGISWDDPWPGVEEGGAQYFQGNHPGSKTRFRVYAVPQSAADDFIATLEAGSFKMTPVGLLAAEASRIAAWRPIFSAEVDERALPAELDLLRTAVHTEKGCYRGQESVARIINLGRPPRRLVFLQLDGSAETLPKPGDSVEYGGRQVGIVTSIAQHWEMGPIALALVKRGLDPSAQVTVAGVDALQEVIVPVEGKSDHAPKTRPGAGLRKLDAGKRDIRTRGPGASG